jgi:tRNA U54 and U55 pseudouridine synthase Pus10
MRHVSLEVPLRALSVVGADPRRRQPHAFRYANVHVPVVSNYTFETLLIGFLLPKEVINIMAALKESMQAKGRTKVRDAVRRRMGKSEKKEQARPRASRPRPSPRRTAH